MRTIFRAFNRNVGRILAYIFVGVLITLLSQFINIGQVHALANTGAFSNLTISDNGMYYNNTDANGVNSSLGGQRSRNNQNDFYYFQSSTDVSIGPSYGDYGVSLTQCDLNFQTEVYYSLTYYFLDSGSVYFYPSYSKVNFRYGIHDNVGRPKLNFDADVYSGSISNGTYFDGFKLHSFTVSFKAPENGACISVALNTKSNTKLSKYYFVGYTYTNFGFKAPTAEEINGSVSSQLQQIQTNMSNMEEHLNSNINASTNEIMEKQEQTNQQLNEIDDTLNNSDVSGASGSANGFFNDFDSNDYGLSDIVTLPLNTIKNITNGVCTPLTIPIPFVNYNATLPCITPLLQTHFPTVLNLYQTITFGIIAYWVCVNILKLVRNFKDPDKDQIEVLDL